MQEVEEVPPTLKINLEIWLECVALQKLAKLVQVYIAKLCRKLLVNAETLLDDASGVISCTLLQSSRLSSQASKYPN